MSHFTLMILSESSNITGETVNAIIDPMLARYSEEIEVPEYDRECHCVGEIAHQEIIDAVELAYPIEALSKEISVWAKENTDCSDPFDPAIEEQWEVLQRPRDAYHAALKESRTDLKDPNPKCNMCKGGGTYRSTYNPEAKWDWYVVGGRWAGLLPGDRDIAPLCEVPNEMVTRAVMTPDGAWHENGSMGWFGMSYGRDEDWPEKQLELREKYPNATAIIVDCHI
jgi:hypothetical protein